MTKQTKLPRRVTVKEIDGKQYAIMVCQIGSERTLMVRKELPETFNHLPVVKQTYWAERILKDLEKKMQREIKSRRILDSNTHKTIDMPQTDLVAKEGNEVQNG